MTLPILLPLSRTFILRMFIISVGPFSVSSISVLCFVILIIQLVLSVLSVFECMTPWYFE